MKKIISLGLCALMMTGCAGLNKKQRDIGTTVLGGAAGGALGSTIGNGRGRLIATTLGTIIGAAMAQSLIEAEDAIQLRKESIEFSNKPSYCDKFSTMGEKLSCKRGMKETNSIIQKQKENDAYIEGKAYPSFE